MAHNNPKISILDDFLTFLDVLYPHCPQAFPQVLRGTFSLILRVFVLKTEMLPYENCKILCPLEFVLCLSHKSTSTTHIPLDANGGSVLRFAYMKHGKVSLYQLLIPAFMALALFSLLVVATPSKASALAVVSETQQVLPLGSNTCAPIRISNFTPYIYDNALNSFEFSVGDASYVAIGGSVGDTSVPLRLMTRLPDSSGGVRIHVDVDTTPLTNTVPITITLLSARTGEPMCASIVATNLGSGPTVASNTSAAPASVPVPSVNPAGSYTNTNHPASGGKAGPGTTGVTSATSASIVQNSLKSLCESAAGAFRLWLIMLVLYALAVGVLLWLEFPVSWAWAQTPERVASIILSLLVLILGFWYFSPTCRAALWMPLVAFLIAVLGLLAAFWNHPKVTQMLLVDEANKPIPMPPAKK